MQNRVNIVNSNRVHQVDQDYNLSEFDGDYELRAMKGIDLEQEVSDDSDIPEEHKNGFHHNEYMQQYKLIIKSVTWNKDSEGLFDYDTCSCVNKKLITNKNNLLVRNDQDCDLMPIGTDVKEKFDGKA